MECLIQYLDDVDDWVYALVLAAERIRRFLARCVLALLSLVMPAAAVCLALWQPPLAMASGSLLLVSLLYRGATAPARRPLPVA